MLAYLVFLIIHYLSTFLFCNFQALFLLLSSLSMEYDSRALFYFVHFQNFKPTLFISHHWTDPSCQLFWTIWTRIFITPECNKRLSPFIELEFLSQRSQVSWGAKRQFRHGSIIELHYNTGEYMVLARQGPFISLFWRRCLRFAGLKQRESQIFIHGPLLSLDLELSEKQNIEFDGILGW